MFRQHQPQTSAALDPDLLRAVIDLIITQQLARPSQVEPHSLLCADLGWDVRIIAKLSIAIEDRWNIRFDDAAVEAWRTVADIARSIEAQTTQINGALS